ncbi:hypothetical protein [Thiomicrorhabdus chilensis]|uniref:hypothetical protein n=1 Tax=Thiomicrorhabdus chilensis TaxID=63656 RepID=UPI00048EBD71|nr:hypothetical protein [Thiomicrorhabdus chilensis]
MINRALFNYYQDFSLRFWGRILIWGGFFFSIPFGVYAIFQDHLSDDEWVFYAGGMAIIAFVSLLTCGREIYAAPSRQQLDTYTTTEKKRNMIGPDEIIETTHNVYESDESYQPKLDSYISDYRDRQANVYQTWVKREAPEDRFIAMILAFFLPVDFISFLGVMIREFLTKLFWGLLPLVLTGLLVVGFFLANQ